MSIPSTCSVSKVNGVTIVAVGSECRKIDEFKCLDLHEDILDAADTADPAIVVVDLSETEYFNNAFNRLLLKAYRKLKNRDGQLALCGLQPVCREVIRVTQLDQLWDIYEDRGEAIAAHT